MEKLSLILKMFQNSVLEMCVSRQKSFHFSKDFCEFLRAFLIFFLFTIWATPLFTKQFNNIVTQIKSVKMNDILMKMVVKHFWIRIKHKYPKLSYGFKMGRFFKTPNCLLLQMSFHISPFLGSPPNMNSEIAICYVFFLFFPPIIP